MRNPSSFIPKAIRPRRAHLILLAVGLVLTSCATRPMGGPDDPAFLRGLVDGFLAPISFVISLFNDQIRMYAFPNIGRWYDFGFLIGLGAWGGANAVSGD